MRYTPSILPFSHSYNVHLCGFCISWFSITSYRTRRCRYFHSAPYLVYSIPFHRNTNFDYILSHSITSSYIIFLCPPSRRGSYLQLHSKAPSLEFSSLHGLSPPSTSDYWHSQHHLKSIYTDMTSASIFSYSSHISFPARKMITFRFSPVFSPTYLRHYIHTNSNIIFFIFSQFLF